MKKRLLLTLVALMGLTSAMATDDITSSDFCISRGETKTFSIQLSNEATNYVGFQMDLTLPEGLTINKAGCCLSDRITDEDQELTIGKQSENTYRLTSTSLSLTPISGTSGDLITISVTASNTYQSGNATISNIQFATSNSNRVTMDDVAISINFAVISFIDANVKALCVANWDTNDDGELDMAEATAVTDLGEVFMGNQNITSFDELQYFTGLTSIGQNAFNGCSSLTSITLSNSIMTIENNAFEGCIMLQHVILGSAVETLGDEVFKDCSALSSINIPESVMEIGFGIFGFCVSLTSIEIPSGISYLRGYTFYGCTSLKSVKLNEGLTIIGRYAFGECNSLEEIILPSTIKTIANDGTTESSAFINCTALQTVVLNNGLELIGVSTFEGCTSLEAIDIPNSVHTIRERSFYGCSSLTSVLLPESIKEISYSAFENCTKLTSIEIPSGITDINGWTFANCSSLSSVKLNEGLVNIGRYAFQGCSKLEEIEFPSTLKRIVYKQENEGGAFKDCISLERVIFNEGLEEIGPNTFQGCSNIKSIVLPNSITIIGSCAFEGCNDLSSVTVSIDSPLAITEDVFTNRANATLYVPWGFKSAYEAADYWNEFKDIVEYGNSEITMGAIGISTYSSSIDLDFTDVDGLKAYIASGYSPSTGELTMTRVYKVPAGEGLLLKGTAGNYDVPYAEVDNIYANMLVGVPTATTVSPTEGSYTNLILANGVNGIGFYTLSKTGEIAAGKAYLQIPTSALPAAGARSINLLFEDEEDNETTGVNDIRNKMEDNRSSIYSLSGQRVGKPAKGLYIKNGKKIMVN